MATASFDKEDKFPIVYIHGISDNEIDVLAEKMNGKITILSECRNLNFLIGNVEIKLFT